MYHVIIGLRALVAETCKTKGGQISLAACYFMLHHVVIIKILQGYIYGGLGCLDRGTVRKKVFGSLLYKLDIKSSRITARKDII